MPNIDYTAMHAQASALGAKRGKAEGRIQVQRDRQARKVRMEQRFAQMAQDKARHANELAKTQFTAAQVAAGEEQKDWAGRIDAGTMTADGTFTDAHWKEEAWNTYLAESGGKVTLEQRQHFDKNIEVYIGKAKANKTGGMSRKYSQGTAEANYAAKTKYISQREAQEGSREYFEGINGAVDRGVNALIDKVSDELGIEELQEPVMRQQPAGKEFSRNPEFDGEVTYADDSIISKLEDFHEVEALDSEGNVIEGNTYRMATDETTRISYIRKDGQWQESKGNVQTVDKTKTGQGKSQIVVFKSPLQDKDFIKQRSFEGRATTSLASLWDTVSSKMANPKDFADRMFESLGNTLAAVVGFDGTESEIVFQYLNATTEEEKALIKEQMGYSITDGVFDAIHAGTQKQRELFATLHLARALQGTGKLSVNAMEAARKVTEGGSGKAALATLEGSRKSMEDALHLSIISTAGHHNTQLHMMKDGSDKKRVERAIGYPVFSSTDYRTQLQQLGYAPDPAIVKQLDRVFASKKIFYKDEHGRTMAPAIVRYTKENGTDSFTISVRPQHYQ